MNLINLTWQNWWVGLGLRGFKSKRDVHGMLYCNSRPLSKIKILGDHLGTRNVYRICGSFCQLKF